MNQATGSAAATPDLNARSPQRARLAIECLLLFGGVPLLLASGLIPMRWMMPLITAGGIAAAIITPRLAASGNDQESSIWRWWHHRGLVQQTPAILRRFVLCGTLILGVMAAVTGLRAWDLAAIPTPIDWFTLPRQRPKLWLVIMCLYPLLSVYPQELIFRGFFCRRYATLFKTPRQMIAVNALAFGWAHVQFLNLPAVLLTLIGGAMFCRTYLQHRSLGSAWLEHTLYGCWVFTVGMGWWFYGGSVSGG